jgi:succinoglycan biosynthesis transport protein ExoP
MAQIETPGNLTGTSLPQFADTSLSDALAVVRKRRWVVIAALGLGIVFGLYRALSQPRLYEPVGRIQVRSGSSDQYKLSGPSGIGQDTLTKMMTEAAIIQSDTLLLNVARELDLANNPAFLGGKPPASHQDIANPMVRQETLLRLQDNLKVSLQPRTDIIRISYSSLSGQLSADIVNTVIQAYIQRSYESRYEATQRVSKWLSKQLEDLKQAVETEQESVLELQRRLGILGFDPTHNQISTELDDLAKAAGQAKLARIVAESRFRMLAGMDPDAIEGSIDSNLGGQAAGLNALRTQLATAHAAYAELESTLGPNHPQSKAAKAQIDDLTRSVDAEQNRLLTQAKENFLIAQANEQKTDAALEAQKADAYRLRDDLVEYTLRQREFEASRTLYESLLEKLRTAGIQAGLESTEIDIVDQAVPPATPALKSKSIIVLTTLLVAGVLGVLIAFILDSLDTSLRSVPDIEATTGMPSLAVVPLFKPSPHAPGSRSVAESNLPVLTEPGSQFAEVFRALRTAILLSTSGHEPRIIMLTSATPAEGKTTVSTNLACILAQSGARILLIDADLRRPTVHHRFGLSGRVGLSTLLNGSSTLEDSIQRVPEIPTLDILASGPIPPFPTDLLNSDSMKQLLHNATASYTHVVIDSPPILSVTDGVLLGSLADVVILVIRYAKSSKQVVRRACDLLLRSNAPLKGIVLNAVDMRALEYYGYSSYGYASTPAEGWESAGKKSQEKTSGPSGKESVK